MTEALDAATFAPIEGTDPALPGDPFTRVRYSYGQLLGADDFTAEQKYHLLRARLRNALLHGSGVVAGLDIISVETIDPPASELRCTAGLAIDPLGREIYVPEAICLDVTGLAANARFWNSLSPTPTPTPPKALTPDPNGGGGEQPAGGETPAEPADPAGGGGNAAPAAPPAGNDPAAPADAPAPPPAPADPAAAATRRCYVVLSYRACLTAQTPAIAAPCSDGDSALAWSRILDSYRLCLEATPPDDPFETVRDWTRRDSPADLRARLQKTLTDVPPVIGRLFNHAEDVKVLLATVDLDASDDGAKIVAVDTGVRALLPPVQSVAEMVMGTRLAGPVDAAVPAHFRVLSADAASNGGAIRITIAFSAPPQPKTIGTDSVKLFTFDPATGWLSPPVGDLTLTGTTLVATLTEDWTVKTVWQVVLAGGGSAPIIDVDNHPLAGLADDPAPPPGRGRDAVMISTFTPA